MKLIQITKIIKKNNPITNLKEIPNFSISLPPQLNLTNFKQYIYSILPNTTIINTEKICAYGANGIIYICECWIDSSFNISTFPANDYISIKELKTS